MCIGDQGSSISYNRRFLLLGILRCLGDYNDLVIVSFSLPLVSLILLTSSKFVCIVNILYTLLDFILFSYHQL